EDVSRLGLAAERLHPLRLERTMVELARLKSGATWTMPQHESSGRDLSSVFLVRPPMTLDADTVAAFDQLLAASVGSIRPASITSALAAPKWQFLCYLCERKSIVLHGSGDPDIAKLEPRKSADVIAFGNREAVYAAADGIWPLFFAIVNRSLPVTSLVNSCVR